MSIIYLALGSNVGNKKNNIEKAVTLVHEKVTDVVRAPMYESKPVGYEKQENFYNTVIKGQTKLSPEVLLTFVKEIEKKTGRKERFQNGPREIDIDILLYDNLVLNQKNLTIPHPRMHERDFVLRPFADISPNTLHPFYKKTIQELLSKLYKENRAILKKIKNDHM